MGLLDRDELTASFFTLTGSVFGEPPRHSVAARAEAAARAGFTHLALAPEEVARTRQHGGELSDLVKIIEGHGLGVSELEPLRGWDDEGSVAETARADESTMCEMAAVFGSRQLNAIRVVGDEVTDEVVAARLGAVCDRVAPYGLLVGLEPRANSPMWSPIQAEGIVRAAHRANAGIVLDSYHFHRAGVSLDQLRTVPAALIASIQLNDMHAEMRGSPAEDALQHRLCPGDGDIDLAGWLAGLDDMGVDVPIAVEIISRDFARFEVDEAAERAAAGARSALSAARAVATARG